MWRRCNLSWNTAGDRWTAVINAAVLHSSDMFYVIGVWNRTPLSVSLSHIFSDVILRPPWGTADGRWTVASALQINCQNNVIGVYNNVCVTSPSDATY